MTTNRSEGIERAIQVLEATGKIGKGLFFYAESGRKQETIDYLRGLLAGA